MTDSQTNPVPNAPRQDVPPHTTHQACDERLKEYGGKTVGCCCTGHLCHETTALDSGELREQAQKVLYGVMEQGNLYKGYVASAEFNVKAMEVISTYWPILETLIEAYTQAKVEEARAAAYSDCKHWLDDPLTSKKGVAGICDIRAKALRGEMEAPKSRFSKDCGRQGEGDAK